MHIKDVSFNYPVGSTNKKTLISNVTKNKSSNELILENDQDAPFFRLIEGKGIFLNQEQLEAVRNTEGPQLLLANPGSGKTRVLTTRAGYILYKHPEIKASQLMLITFTSKAANEMKERLKQMDLISEEDIDKMYIGTFHSIFLRMLQSRGYKQKVISSDAFKEIVIKKSLSKLKLEKTLQPETVIAAINNWKNQGLSPDDVETPNTFLCNLVKCFVEYEEWKLENNYIDYEDMLCESLRILRNDEKFRLHLQSYFQYIFIDEYQDSNSIQDDLIREILNVASNVFFVGDPKQTIYSFRNSSSKNIEKLKLNYPNLTINSLRSNYRSSREIVGLTNRLIPASDDNNSVAVNTEAGYVGYIRPSHPQEEAEWVARHIMDQTCLEHSQLSNYAILYRTHALSRSIVDVLAFYGVPFVIYGNAQSFYEDNLIKPLVGYLRLTEKPTDVQALVNIASTFYLSKEKVEAAALRYHAYNPTKPVMNCLFELGLKPFQIKTIKERMALMDRIANYEPVNIIKHLRKSFYDKYIGVSDKNNTVQKEMMLESLSELESAAKRFQVPGKFLSFIDNVLDMFERMDELKQEPKPDAVRLMTIHQAKGLEFPTVFVIGASENIIPHSSAINADQQEDRLNIMTKEMAIEEEKRILFVALSRAENELYISSPKMYHDKQVEVSRFLLEAYS